MAVGGGAGRMELRRPLGWSASVAVGGGAGRMELRRPLGVGSLCCNRSSMHPSAGQAMAVNDPPLPSPAASSSGGLRPGEGTAGEDVGRGLGPAPALAPAPAPGAIGPRQLFLAFSGLALSGFGGVLPFAYRALVEKRRWLDAHEFASLLAIAQVMPGPTICNLSVMIGQRYAGFAGACAALAGMVLGPSCIVIALGIAWQRFGGLSSVRHALGGMSAVAIGLILATAVKMGSNLFRPPAPARAPRKAPPEAAPVSSIGRYWTWQRLMQVVLCALGFVGVGLLRWPLAAVVAGLAPIAIATWWRFDR